MNPIVSALRHHKTTVVLVALEIALSCAIITNALFLIGNRVSHMQVSTGVDDQHLVWATTNTLYVGQKRTHAGMVSEVADDLAALRRIPGVESATVTTSLPLAGGYMSTDVYRRPGDKSSIAGNVIEDLATAGTLKTLGIKISEGRGFRSQEYGNHDLSLKSTGFPDAAIVTRDLADRLWPGKDPLGKPIYFNQSGSRVVHVVGVTEHLLNPIIGTDHVTDRGLILPVQTVGSMATYALRVEPDRRVAVKRAIPGILLHLDPARSVQAHVYTHTIHQYFHNDRAMIWLLAVVVGCLLALTALGVVGLSSFWVQQRTKIIGIRRAIGATRGDILRYFLVENFLIVSLGVAVGTAGAVGLNLWLMRHYELERMPLTWLPAGALVLWALGLVSALGPALRASRVPPVVATRSV
jgi:putative ABC transport system permease protein